MKGIEKALNVLSLGNFSKVKKKLGYEDVWHQYMIVEYTDGTKKKIERNHIVESHDVSPEDLKNTIVKIPVKQDLTTRQMIDNTLKNDTDNNFWKYDYRQSNCQLFVKEIIDSNDLLPDIDTSQVLQTQDAKRLSESLPPVLRDIPLLVTDTASALDKIAYGRGVGGKGVDKDTFLARLIVDGIA
jgi:hypothetical protein